jgi:hypothetical protein
MNHLTKVFLAVGVALTLTACGAAVETAGQVGNAASTAAVCAEAVQIATANSDVTDPQAAADRAHKAADELTGLASRAANTTAADAITKLATTMRETTVAELTSSPAAWIREKTDQVAALTKACGG